MFLGAPNSSYLEWTIFCSVLTVLRERVLENVQILKVFFCDLKAKSSHVAHF